MTKIVYIPNQILAPIIAILCFLGAYVAKNYVFDIWIMVALGIFAFFASRNGYPTVPMILGFILADLIEGNFHRSLGVGFGSPMIFVTRPIALVMLVITVVFIAWPWIVDFIKRRQVTSAKTIEVLSAITDEEVEEVSTGEIIMGGVVVAVLLVFLVTSFSYSAEVRLFPVIVCIVGLILSLYWLFVAVRTKKITRSAFTGLSVGKGGMPWLIGLASLVVYALAVPVLGFLIASTLYFVLVPIFAGYKMANGRWKPIAATAVGVVLFLFVFTRFLQVDLPPGVLAMLGLG
jgi:hypothetical protein